MSVRAKLVFADLILSSPRPIRCAERIPSELYAGLGPPRYGFRVLERSCAAAGLGELDLEAREEEETGC